MTTTTAPASLNIPTTLAALYLPRWRAEFPDFPCGDMPALPAAWVDTSWHNDACPSFMVAEREHGERLRGWVDFADPAMRDNGPDMPRFILQWDTLRGEAGRVVYEGDDAAAFIALGQIEALAFAFAVNVRRSLLPTEWQALRLANRLSDRGACNANNYCDANMSMLDAFVTITGRDPIGEADGFADADMEAFNEAWDIARQHHLTADEDGARFDAWCASARDVDRLEAEGVETGPDYETTTTPGRIYEPGFITALPDGRWHCVVSNHDVVCDDVDDAETYLWAHYADAETRACPPLY